MVKKQQNKKEPKAEKITETVKEEPIPFTVKNDATNKEATVDKRVGNEFWKMRSKHGRDKLFASPALMWEAACEYFQWCEDNPFMRSEAKTVSMGNNMGSSIELAEVPVMRPFTLHGLCLYVGASTSYFRAFKSDARKEEGKNKDFLTVIDQIEETIYEQKFAGAASGFLNSNIIARDLGLKDQSDVTSEGKALKFRIGYKRPDGKFDESDD